MKPQEMEREITILQFRFLLEKQNHYKRTVIKTIADFLIDYQQRHKSE